MLEREVEGAREEGGEGETGQEGGQETSCEMLPGEEAEVRQSAHTFLYVVVYACIAHIFHSKAGY